MNKPLLIYGAGGLGREVLSMLHTLPEWNIKGFIDDGAKPGKRIHGIEVLGGLAFLNAINYHVDVVIALGSPEIKADVVRQLKNSKISFPILIHPSAILLDKGTIKIGNGTIICAGCVLTTDMVIGEHVLVNINSTVGHDAFIGSFTSIMPGVNIAGEVHIEERVLVGAGVSIRNKLRIKECSTIGMGSVVVKDVAANVTVAGVPARPLSL